MARAALGWTLDDLAAASDVGRRTVARFEAGELVLPGRVQKLRQALEAGGVVFVDQGQWAGAVVPPREGPI
jgi:transcriptional regulator with XRE-family HTH domain